MKDWQKKYSGVMLLCFALLLFTACAPMNKHRESPGINGELAYRYAAENVAFGDRYAGSEALRKSADWIVKTLRSVPGDYQVEVMAFEERTPVSARKTVFRNLVASWDGPGKDYVILGAHYDTKRFFSGMKFEGANDGASGVGVLLAIQQTLSELKELPIGIRLVFFDGEECILKYDELDGLVGSRYLAEKWSESGELEHCRGMLLLDMVGDKDLCFTFPKNSDKKLLKLAFQEAERLNLDKHVSMFRGDILDDHVPFMKKSVPALDFIDFQYGPDNGYWHTSRDSMDKISAESLKIAGDLALAVAWRLAD